MTIPPVEAPLTKTDMMEMRHREVIALAQLLLLTAVLQALEDAEVEVEEEIAVATIIPPVEAPLIDTGAIKMTHREVGALAEILRVTAVPHA